MDDTELPDDIEYGLKDNTIDTKDLFYVPNDVAILTNDTYSASDIYTNWKKFGNAGDWTVDTALDQIINRQNTVGTTGWYNKQVINATDMTIEFEFCPYDSDDDFVGVILRANIDEDKSSTSRPLDTKVTGYWYWECGKGNAQSYWQNNSTGLYKCNSVMLARNGADSDKRMYANLGGKADMVSDFRDQTGIKVLEGFNSNRQWPYKSSYTNNWISYKFDITGKRIRVWRDGLNIIDYTDNDNCISSGSFALINESQASRYRNFKVTYTQSKSAEEIARQMKWRDNSIRVVNYIDRRIDNSLENPGVIAQTLNNNIDYINWFTNTNKDFIEKFIGLIDNNGQGFYYRKEDIVGP